MLNILNFRLKNTAKKKKEAKSNYKNANFDETKLRDTKNISTRNNTKLPRLWNLKFWKTSQTSRSKNEVKMINDSHVSIIKKYCYWSMAVQCNLVVGFLYKVFINSVFLGW